MVDILDEVKEELKYENILKRVKQYGPYFIIGIVIFISVIAGKVFWSNYQQNKIYSDGGDFQIAFYKLKAGKLDEALERFQKIEGNGTAYADLATLNLAKSKELKGKFTEANELYGQLENSGRDLYEDLAKLQKIVMQYQNREISTDDAMKSIEKFARKDATFANIAKEILIHIAIANGKFEKAAEIYKEVQTDPKFPPNVKERIEQVYQITNLK